jgi:putative membrane protein
MFGYEWGIGIWWIFPLLMIAVCMFFMARRGGMMCCGMGSHEEDHGPDSSGSALEILDRRYALGEIDKAEYEEKKRAVQRQQ